MFLIALSLTLCFINVHGDQKTFPAGFSKKDFRVTTLKDPNFANDEEPPLKDPPTEDCPDFSPDELKKIKQDYNSDGARVQFVSSDTLAVDEKEVKRAACLKKILAASESSEKKMKASFDSPVKFENRTSSKNSTGEKGKRRGNEYEFDTVEYYDDVDAMVFENEICPGLVDIIDVDVADIRKYDVECEKMCEWSSLYDHGTWDESSW